MKSKRYIACWLLVVYLLTAIGPAYASLTCRCTVMKARTEAIGCCHHHDHADCHASAETTPERAELSAPCCDDRHSTEIALYTNGNDDRTDRTVLPVLTALLPENRPATSPDIAFLGRIADHRVGFLCHGTVRCTGLRAPPTRH